MPAERFRTQQLRHFLLWNATPVAITVTAPLFFPSGWLHPAWIALTLGMWIVVGGLGVSVGLHRYFSHRAIVVRPWAKWLFGICGAMAAQGPITYWVSIHRRHHAFSDQCGDPHSPLASANGANGSCAAFLQGHFGWVLRHDVPRAGRYAPDLLADKGIQIMDRHYYLIASIGILGPAAIGGFLYEEFVLGAIYGAYWGGFLRIALGHQIIWSVNSACHKWGPAPYRTGDSSTNIAALSIISFGESWHNNHHNAPTSAAFSHHGSQIDIGWLIIKLLRVMGVVLAVRQEQRKQDH
jgi:stearoyl-CoA desaturase (delta-9 desaturase)